MPSGGAPHVAVILVTYNRSDVTNLALDSLSKAKCEIPFSTIIIDNLSQISEYERIKRVFDYLTEDGLLQGQIVRNEKNLGYAAGNNVGIRLALADPKITHICLLNNDTIVTEGWLDGLVRYSENALVGPVSNSVGNEQIIGVDYSLSCPDGYMRDAAQSFGKRWRALHKGNFVKTEMLGFFCVLGSRELFEKVGLLDEEFGIGYYEDDDFCYRAKKEGFDLKIIREVFVHHWGSASFGPIDEQRNQKLFQKNKAIFERKHGHSPVHVKDSWGTSLGHEISWIAEARAKNQMTEEKAISLASNWIPSLKQDIYKTVNRPSFAPGGLFRVYVQAAINFRLSKKSEKIPRWIRTLVGNFLELTMSTRESRKYLVRKYFNYPLWKCSLPLRKLKGAALRLNSGNEKTKAVVILPIQSYHGRRQRPQHIADGLAKQGYHVFWIEPEIANSLTWPWKPSIIFKSSKTPYLTIGYLTGFDFGNFYVSGWSESESSRFLSFLSSALREMGIELNQSNLIVESPFWANVLKIYPGQRIYECMDFHDEFQSATVEVQLLEDLLYNECDQLVTTSTYLKDRLHSIIDPSTPIHLIRNGCEPKHFIAASSLKKEEAKNTGLCVGYYGAVAEWFNDELFVETAKLLPHVTFEVIGDCTRSTLKDKIPSNVKLLGERSYSELPGLTRHWAAAMIPFRLTKLILATNPVKLYEYSALGLPVVTTSIPEVKEAAIETYFGDTPDEFAKAIVRAIETDSEIKRKERQAFALENSWELRALAMCKILDAKTQEPNLSLKSTAAQAEKS